ncbi:MAG: hypothetical protein IJJ43_06285 [Oscillospiraceae bacterium]|nr:hypothetical protein [Oscillospiraceae bacterium]MBQ6465856.1 hypothetical protein [Oscillospiraceae bacterium]
METTEIKEVVFYYTGNDKGEHLIAGIFDDVKEAVRTARADFERVCRIIRDKHPNIQDDPNGAFDHFTGFNDYDPVVGGGWNAWDGEETVFIGALIPRLCKVGSGIFEPCHC